MYTNTARDFIKFCEKITYNDRIKLFSHKITPVTNERESLGWMIEKVNIAGDDALFITDKMRDEPQIVLARAKDIENGSYERNIRQKLQKVVGLDLRKPIYYEVCYKMSPEKSKVAE